MVIYLVHDSTQTPAKFSFSGKTACESRGKDINGSVFGSCSLFSNFFSNISRLVAPLPILVGYCGLQENKKPALLWASKLRRAVLYESI